ncbi:MULTISPECIES: CHAP domain-containing protein [unclassified Sphingomonas]|uniref:CHAP domain-containing protein n=1 Tax=unclassified Sphingomonas TaxID=196159 RepID=UPI0018346119|nr:MULTISPECIES: CHAP domain-containing protein [unclassified Sphingomonas]MBB3349147.1 surface antigen [Sphingomonas sp. BK069]MBB3474407.1 surface antigen [Sphingomonas sp. BK345]
MNSKALTARFALVVSCALMTVAPAQARYLQCVPFAREVSGIEIRGNANTWWGQAAGRYERGHVPVEGAVMAFKATRGMPIGHVAMVSRVVSDREVLLTHANWSRRGGIERDVRAIDVSPAGDWSAVRVWYAGNGDLGTSSYPLAGFIYPDKAPAPEVEAPLAPMTIATTAAAPVAGALPIDGD